MLELAGADIPIIAQTQPASISETGDAASTGETIGATSRLYPGDTDDPNILERHMDYQYEREMARRDIMKREFVGVQLN